MKHSQVIVLAGLLLAACSNDPGGNGNADTVGPTGDTIISGGDTTPEATVLPDGRIVPPDTREPDAVGDTGVGDGAGGCDEGERVCSSPKEVAECQAGKWVVVTVCPDTHFCSAGTCVKNETCTPGVVDGCYGLDSFKQCNLEGTGFIPVKCPDGQKCADGKCGEFDCLPGQAVCTDNKTKKACGLDGTWGEPEACPEGLNCVGGKCLSQCLTDPKWNNSYIGCEYWTLDLDNYHDKYSAGLGGVYPDEAPHGVILANPGTAPAVVTFTCFAPDINFNVPEITIPAGEHKVVEMPRMDVDGSVITNRSVRINSNRPIVAYQFNPLDFQGAYSDDSSLLIPTEVVGIEYFAMTLSTSPLEAMPMTNDPSQHGYFTVLAVEPGITKVSVKVTAKSEHPTKPGEFLLPNAYNEFTLEQGQVLNIQATGKELSFKLDLTGSHIIADRKVAVFSGHEEAVVSFPEVEGGCCCAEHLEEQMFPVETWDTQYLAVKAAPRGPSDKDLWRVVAGKQNITLKTVPPIAGIDGETLMKGEYAEGITNQSFQVIADGPIQVGQYLASQGCTDDFTGDPALIMSVSTSQFRSNYVFAVPKDYDADWIAVAKPVGSQVTLNGTALEQAKFKTVADGTFEVGYFKVQDGGPYHLESDQSFGLYQYGFSGPASYGHAGGLNLIKKQQ